MLELRRAGEERIWAGGALQVGGRGGGHGLQLSGGGGVVRPTLLRRRRPSVLWSRGVAAPAALAAAAAAGCGGGRRHGAAPAPAAVLPAEGRQEEGGCGRSAHRPSPNRRVPLLTPSRTPGREKPTQPRPHRSKPSDPAKFRAKPLAYARVRGLSGQWLGAIAKGAPNGGRKGGMRNGEGKEEGDEPPGPRGEGRALLDLLQ